MIYGYTVYGAYDSKTIYSKEKFTKQEFIEICKETMQKLIDELGDKFEETIPFDEDKVAEKLLEDEKFFELDIVTVSISCECNNKIEYMRFE